MELWIEKWNGGCWKPIIRQRNRTEEETSSYCKGIFWQVFSTYCLFLCRYDINKNGTIEPTELALILNDLGEHVDYKDLKNFLAYFDTVSFNPSLLWAIEEGWSLRVWRVPWYALCVHLYWGEWSYDSAIS